MAIQERAGKYLRTEAETRINAPPETVFAAITTGMDAWWPHRTDEKARVVFETKPGGTIYEDHGGGSHVLYGTLAGYQPPTFVATLYFNGYSEKAFIRRNIDRLEPDGQGGTIYKRTLILWGEISEEMSEIYATGLPDVLAAAKKHIEG